MLDLVTAVRFDRRVGSGRTRPILLACAKGEGDEVEAVCKLSAGCDLGVGALVAEAIAAMLAADLDLPVPEPFLVRLDQEFIDLIPEPEVKALAARSVPIAFGSKKLSPSFSTWPVGKPIPHALIDAAAEIFAFDALISNSDRRPSNPNCLSDGRALAIFDHELAFITEGIIGWRPPWQAGALEDFRRPGVHLFSDALRGKDINLARLAGAWDEVTEVRLAEYRRALPPEWSADGGVAERALGYISQVRDNVESAFAEIHRVLK